ncbi:MAG: 2-C-methyl-D-erythritol 2,4-cyclodiphosphate synthase [Candidatus Omnitrophica bacterium]|nr:2-C-methyl-D-erythritol 2,4-cyclodiphosphate synthase [Candidatus Omnitrophota bacterium]
MRVGMGFDIHRLAENRPLILGGIRVPHPKGLLGHSDADVVLHALCDALLGAVGEGDIGLHFPDSDPRWKGAQSRDFIEKALEFVRRRNLKLANADLVLLAEAPKLSGHRQAIQRSVAEILSVKPDRVNVKAKTMEGLGPIGSQEAVASYAVVLLE